MYATLYVTPPPVKTELGAFSCELQWYPISHAIESHSVHNCHSAYYIVFMSVSLLPRLVTHLKTGMITLFPSVVLLVSGICLKRNQLSSAPKIMSLIK